jgi:hypothetical protein
VFEQYVRGSGASRTFAVIYDGVDAILRTSLGDDDVRVFGDNDFSAPATFLGMAKTRHGNGLIGRYRVDGLLGGLYEIEMGEGAIKDVTNAPVTGGVIGAFRIARRGRTTVENPPVAQGPMLNVVGTTYGPSFAPPAIDTSFGTVIGALNFGGSAMDVTGTTGQVVHFQSQHAGGTAGTTLPFSVSVVALTATPSATDVAERSVGSQGLYETEIYSFYGPDLVMKISGLDPAKSYRFQFLHGDSRLGSSYAATQHFSLPNTGEQATAPLAFDTTTADADSNTVVIVSGTDVLKYQMPPAPTKNASFSGLVVEESSGGGGSASQMGAATYLRKSIRLTGAAGQMFDLSFANGGGRVVTAAGLASTAVTLSGPGGYSALATLVGFSTTDPSNTIVTYRIDGVESTGSYAISVGGQAVAKPTLFFLTPIKWETNTVVTRRRRHPLL